MSLSVFCYCTCIHVFSFFIVTISVSTHLCVICCLFYSLILIKLLFQGRVACGNFTLVRASSITIQCVCKFVYHNVQAHIQAFPDIFALSPYFSITYLLFAGYEIHLFTRLKAFVTLRGQSL